VSTASYMGKRSERAKAEMQEWSDVAVWLSDVIDAVEPADDADQVTLFPAAVASRA
jgi:hypothetical protein